ncbi:MAG: hypothetical protein ACKOQX_09675, partial [Actinomycetota bacterium]
MSTDLNRPRRRRNLLTIGLALLLVGQFFPTAVVEADAPTGDYIVLFAKSADLSSKITKEARLGNAISDVFDGSTNGFVAELDAADVRRL